MLVSSLPSHDSVHVTSHLTQVCFSGFQVSLGLLDAVMIERTQCVDSWLGDGNRMASDCK